MALPGEGPWQSGASCHPSQEASFSLIQFGVLLLSYFLLGRLLVQLSDSCLPGPSFLGAELSRQHNPGLLLSATADSPAKRTVSGSFHFPPSHLLMNNQKDMFLEA